MISHIIILCFVLLIIFIITYCLIYDGKYDFKIYEIEYNVDYVNNKTESNTNDCVISKMVSSESVNITNNSSANVYFEIPFKESFWILEISDADQCIHSINTADFQSINPGDTLHLIITDNNVVLEKTKNYFMEYHNQIAKIKNYIPYHVALSGTFFIRFEIYSINSTYKKDIDMKKLEFSNIGYEICKSVVKKRKISNIIENRNMFQNYINDIFHSYMLKNTVEITDEKIINISQTISSKDNFEIYAINHYKSRTAIHSHILFIDEDTKIPFRIEFTGVKTDKIFGKKQIEIRKISFKPPPGIERFIAVERIFFDGDYITKYESIIPMHVLIL